MGRCRENNSGTPSGWLELLDRLLIMAVDVCYCPARHRAVLVQVWNVALNGKNNVSKTNFHSGSL
jgi:hypothetical protein